MVKMTLLRIKNIALINTPNLAVSNNLLHTHQLARQDNKKQSITQGNTTNISLYSTLYLSLSEVANSTSDRVFYLLSPKQIKNG